MRCPARRNSSRSISPNGGPTAPSSSDAMSNLRDASARLGPECFLDRIAHRECEGRGADQLIGHLFLAVDCLFGQFCLGHPSPVVFNWIGVEIAANGRMDVHRDPNRAGVREVSVTKVAEDLWWNALSSDRERLPHLVQ